MCNQLGDGNVAIRVEESPHEAAKNGLIVVPPDELKLMASLAKKVGLMYEKTEWAKKDKSNDALKYMYASADQMYDDIRKNMAEVGLAILPIMGRPEVERTDNAGKARFDTRVFLPIILRLIDSETGFSFDIPGYGESADTGDKGVSKAITSAVKYTLRTLFLIPTGDDPDAGKPEDKKSNQSQTQQKAAVSDPLVERSKQIGKEIGINLETGKKINHAAKQLGVEGFKLIVEAYDAGERTADGILVYIETKAIEAWLASIGMDAPKMSDFKAACDSHGVGHASFAAEAREAGCKTIDQIYAYLNDGEKPSEEQKAENPPSGASAMETKPGSSAHTAQPSSPTDEGENPFVNEAQLIESYEWKDGEINRLKSICKAKDLDWLKVMERGVTKKFTTGFQLITWAKDGAK